MTADYAIYCVIDPRDGELRYIGRTKQNLAMRIHAHRRAKDKSHRANWFRSMEKDGVMPRVFVLEETTKESCGEAERSWIAHFRGLGCDLVNCAEGGEGALLANRNSFRKGQKAWNSGKTWSAATRKKIGDVQRGKPKGPQSPEHRANHLKAMQIRNNPKTWSAKRRAALAGENRRAVGLAWHTKKRQEAENASNA